MRLFVVLVAFTVIFASCGGGPAVEAPADAHAIPQSRGRAQPAAQGDPIEKRSVVKFADGSVDEYTTSVYDEKKPAQLNLQERFSASGQLVEQIEYTYNEDNGLLTTKITKSDENKIKNRVVYQYDGKNLVLESFVNSKGKLVSSFGYAYDKDGNMLARIINNASSVKLTETKYHWENGVVVSSETLDPNGRKISSAKNEYDAAKNLVRQTVYNASGAVSRRINAEWQNGRETKNEQTAPNGTVQIRVTNEYGAAGELIRRTIENIEGQSTQILEYEYTFQQGSRARAR
jgi:hypothetical protein